MQNLGLINNYNYMMRPPMTNVMVQHPCISPVNTTKTNTIKTSTQNTINPSFRAYSTNNINQIRTHLINKDEQYKYNTVTSHLDKKTKKSLQELLKTGKLLNNNSNDKSTTLDNLFKIATQTRIIGLDKEKLLKETIETIRDPFIITQKFGDIPVAMQSALLQQELNDGKNITATDLDVKSSTCPAASIEFDMAQKMPAEFTRFVEGLSSAQMSVTKNLSLNELSQGTVSTLSMHNEFGTEHKLIDKNTISVKIKPDRNAIIRARIQNTYKDRDERSIIDVLMQSTIMNLGAQNTYDSLIDKRKPKYNDDDCGLIDIEKNFAEEIITGKGKVCVTYQKIDDNGKLVGYECEPQETLQHIKNTLDAGNNVIIGYTYCDNENNVIGGHEITIIGIEQDRKGQLYFVCNDTDDGIPEAIKYPVDELLPKIHHAGIPKNILEGNVEFVEGWKELMQHYQNTRQAQAMQQVQYMPPQFNMGLPMTPPIYNMPVYPQYYC